MELVTKLCLVHHLSGMLVSMITGEYFVNDLTLRIQSGPQGLHQNKIFKHTHTRTRTHDALCKIRAELAGRKRGPGYYHGVICICSMRIAGPRSAIGRAPDS